MKIQIDPKVDYAFKHVFGREQNKPVLMSLLDAVTIAVCFVDTPLFPELDDYHLIFELRERQRYTLFTDQMAVHILELTKFNKTIDELTTSLNRWLFFLRHAEHLDANALPEPLDVPEVRWALGDLMMISQNAREREVYESRQKMQRDVYTALAEKLDEGREQGRQEGREQGERKSGEHPFNTCRSGCVRT